MKVAIYQFWDGNVRESALAGVKNMKSYAEKIGADYKFENNPNWLKRDLKIFRKKKCFRDAFFGETKRLKQTNREVVNE